MKLEGKVALVTGAGRGLGRAYALRLASLGADVVVNDIDLNSAAVYAEELTAPSVEEEVRALGRRAIGIRADVGDKAEVDSMMAQTMDEFGGIDVLVCNAGGLRGDPETSFASSVSEEDFDATLDTNLRGTVLCCQAAVPHMRSHHGGKIVNVTSEYALRSSRGGKLAAYGTAKAAIIGYTMYLAEEVGEYGITVNAIAPGYIQTAMAIAELGDEGGYAEAAGGVALRRWGTTHDCAGVVEFLCTDLSDYVTGQVIVVDGGLSLLDPLG
ncbi:MAG: glucose 1-dehydrogenase [Actinomycetota bacterium]|nr:glucose 1-dehydrogenase [Actinomycetota bacterium]